ncbi:MAG: hypothetical protein HYY04_09440 [Chloroflexi bacterium]|nr:hypothetical protein [Chloroflexota bacterium]
MARLQLPMPPVVIDRAALAAFGQTWTNQGGRLSRTPPHSSAQLGRLFEEAVASSLAGMLGNIPVVPQTGRALIPPSDDCVEVGEIRMIGGVRPQNFDVAYRPDGVRFAFDAKTLNDLDSVRKNWQNMVNDLSTEATTIHSRFPYAVVSFLVAIPKPCLLAPQRAAIIETLERLARRADVGGPIYLAEAISLVLWDPASGAIDPTIPDPESPSRIERFPQQVQPEYVNRYKGLPPHAD